MPARAVQLVERRNSFSNHQKSGQVEQNSKCYDGSEYSPGIKASPRTFRLRVIKNIPDPEQV